MLAERDVRIAASRWRSAIPDMARRLLLDGTGARFRGGIGAAFPQVPAAGVDPSLMQSPVISIVRIKRGAYRWTVVEPAGTHLRWQGLAASRSLAERQLVTCLSEMTKASPSLS